MTDITSSPAPAAPDLSNVVCGYCATPGVPVNATSGEVRAHKRQFAGRAIRCIGSGQRAFIYPGNLRDGDEFSVVGDPIRFTVDGQPTVPADSNVWTIPLTAGGDVRWLPGDTLLRLWTRQAGDR